jgi:hypothetical protein
MELNYRRLKTEDCPPELTQVAFGACREVTPSQFISIPDKAVLESPCSDSPPENGTRSDIAFTVYRWDINVRMSTVIGFVGGGGIGFLLQQWIRLLMYEEAGAAVWTIAIVVVDYASAKVGKKVV